MAEQINDLEQQVESLILAGFAQQEQQDPNANTQDGQNEPTEGKRVIDVDLYHLQGGAVLLVPNNGQNPLDTNAVESVASTTEPDTVSPSTPAPVELQQEDQPPEQEAEPIALAKKRVKPSYVLVPLVLLFILATGAASYMYLLPLTASATVTITPQARSLHRDVSFTIATNPKAGQVQGRELQSISLTKSITVPATGHAHEDATRAVGVITFYNADSQAYTIPAGVSFSVQGVTVVIDASVTVQAAIPPSFGVAIAPAHTIQAGSIGNIAARVIYTRCCGSDFITATNITPFSGGQDARDYSFVQTSDIQNATTTLLSSLTPQATATLAKEARSGEQLVTPLCTPRTTSSQDAGAVAASITVSVTQNCSSVAYRTDSLNLVATSTLARQSDLVNFQQVGSTQVTVNGSTYEKHTATLHVSLSGVWVYRFTQAQLAQLTQSIAGESKEQATAILKKVAGVMQVSIHLQRFDFRDSLPTNTTRISIQFFYIVSP
jgi:hypothetical protein